jgi:hypothetical protein
MGVMGITRDMEAWGSWRIVKSRRQSRESREAIEAVEAEGAKEVVHTGGAAEVVGAGRAIGVMGVTESPESSRKPRKFQETWGCKGCRQLNLTRQGIRGLNKILHSEMRTKSSLHRQFPFFSHRLVRSVNLKLCG